DRQVTPKKPTPAVPQGPGAGERLLKSSKALWASASGKAGQAARWAWSRRPSKERARTLNKVAALTIAGMLVFGTVALSYHLLTKSLVQAALNVEDYAKAHDRVKWCLKIQKLPEAFSDDSI